MKCLLEDDSYPYASGTDLIKATSAVSVLV